MKLGIVGWPQSGKTTVFNSLTGLSASTGGGGKEAFNVGVVKVPDPRLTRLRDMLKPDKITFADIHLFDLPPPSTTEAGQVFETKALAAMRELEALAHVVRAFHGPLWSVSQDVVKAMSDFLSETVLSDLLQIEKRLERLRKEGKHASREAEMLGACKAHLEAPAPLRKRKFTRDEEAALAGFGFLSIKPQIVVVNAGDEDAGRPLPQQIKDEAASEAVAAIPICGKIEMELAQLDQASAAEFMEALGIEEPAAERFVRAAYGLLDLITFFTTANRDFRAWSLPRGSTAFEAAGRIHTDMQKGFIKAEVVAYDDFAQLGGSEPECRKAGKLRLEGKDYVVQDGDILKIRFGKS